MSNKLALAEWKSKITLLETNLVVTRDSDLKVIKERENYNVNNLLKPVLITKIEL